MKSFSFYEIHVKNRDVQDSIYSLHLIADNFK